MQAPKLGCLRIVQFFIGGLAAGEGDVVVIALNGLRLVGIEPISARSTPY